VAEAEAKEKLRRAISHDLRQPLTALMARADLLSASLARQGLDRELRHAQAIETIAEKMNQLIEQLAQQAAAA